MSQGQEAGGTYELTVAGGLGPVLRAAFATKSIATVETTTLRLEVAEDRDLVDVIAMLDTNGVRIQGVYRLGPGDLDPHAGPGSLAADEVPGSRSA